MLKIFLLVGHTVKKAESIVYRKSSQPGLGAVKFTQAHDLQYTLKSQPDSGHGHCVYLFMNNYISHLAINYNKVFVETQPVNFNL